MCRAPCFFGNASTGKSILIHAISVLFNPEDVGVLGNDNQKSFGLQDLYWRPVVIMEEIGTKMNLDNGTWNSMVTGGFVEVNEKYGTAHKERWKANLVMAGNTGLAYKNAKGSTARRCLVFEMQKRPTKPDCTLETQLSENAGSLVVMVNRAYRALVEYSAEVNPDTRGLEHVIPQEFQNCRAKVAAAACRFERFLMSTYVQYPTSAGVADNVYCPKEKLLDAFMKYEQDNNIRHYVCPDDDKLLVLRNYGFGDGVREIRTSLNSATVFRVWPRPLGYDSAAPQTNEMKGTFYSGIDVCSRISYSDIGKVSSDMMCVDSCAFNTSLHYRGTIPARIQPAAEIVWDSDTFRTMLSEHVNLVYKPVYFGSHSYSSSSNDNVNRTLAVDIGRLVGDLHLFLPDVLTKAFYLESVRRLDEIMKSARAVNHVDFVKEYISKLAKIYAGSSEEIQKVQLKLSKF